MINGVKPFFNNETGHTNDLFTYLQNNNINYRHRAVEVKNISNFNEDNSPLKKIPGHLPQRIIITQLKISVYFVIILTFL